MTAVASSTLFSEVAAHAGAREELAIVLERRRRAAASGGGSVLGSPGGMSDTDTIQSSGNSVERRQPQRAGR